MKILFVVPYVPNLVRVRPYNLIRFLAARGHQVTVLTVWADEAELADIDALKQYCYEVIAQPMPKWRSLLNCVAVIPRNVPFQSVFSWQPALVEAFKGGNGGMPYDIVHVEHLRGSRYGLFFKDETNLPVVWDSVDSITHLFRQTAVKSSNHLLRWRSKLDLGRTQRYEAWLPEQFERVLVTSPTDREALLGLNKSTTHAEITVLPNGVDLEYFRPDETAVRERATLIISGKMSYHANISMVRHLVEDIMPYVWAKRPETQIWIVGKDPAPEILALADDARIKVTGTVSDMRHYLCRATISVAPLTYGAGIQNKILEAMACGTPVVTVPTAVCDLGVVPERDLFVAEKGEQFAEAILLLLADEARRRQLGEGGRQYVEAQHNWQHVAGNLEQIYQDVVKQKSSNSISS